MEQLPSAAIAAMAAKARRVRERPPFDRIALLLQGGGALGSYQAGVYAALAQAELQPDWVAGISIGAINGALIAGNAPERRVEQLTTFWEHITKAPLGLDAWFSPPSETSDIMRGWANQTSAAKALFGGASGFFTPRPIAPWFIPAGGAGATSYYDTAKLRSTLERLVDFDRINSGSVRFTVGAVNVRSGNLVCFDTETHRIGPEHVMASGALPPGFPPIEIDNEPYWDGGLVSNTPLQHVLEGSGPRQDMVIFQIDLFSARGPVPATLFEIAQREKEIRYSSRTRLNTDIVCELQAIRRAVRHLRPTLSEQLASNADWQLLDRLSCDAAITIVQLIHRRAAYWTQSNDYEFSRFTMEEHWTSGRADVERTLNHPEWKSRTRPEEGVKVLDLTRDLDTQAQGRAS